MRKPVIGITTYGRDDNGRFSLSAAYVDAVRRAGGIPVLMPPGEPALGELLSLLNGVILSGGGDIDPQRYAGDSHEAIYMIDPERDASEINMARNLVNQDLPVLGVCRGTQVINVALGGTLIEHLPDVVGEEIAHRTPPRSPAMHVVNVKPKSRLATIIGETTINGTSWHHQAIRKPAQGLQVVASAPDGTIEAVEMPDHPWLFAVQWHPEITAADDVCQQRIFDELVNVARQKMQAKK